MNEVEISFLEDLMSSGQQAMRDQEQLTLEAFERITNDLRRFCPADWKLVSEDLRTIAYAAGLRHNVKGLLS